MKIAVIGGGGVRSVFLAKSIAARAEELKINELVFMTMTKRNSEYTERWRRKLQTSSALHLILKSPRTLWRRLKTPIML